MKSTLSFLLLFSTSIFFSTEAQNIVPDPGFEIIQRLPSGKNNPLACTKNWLSPTLTASDYYHDDAKWHAGAPRNIFGRQKPHSGKGYAGMCIRKNFMEYVQTQLATTMIKDREYLVEFYICKAERSLSSVNEFGVLFTGKMQWSYDIHGIPAKPDIDFPNSHKYKNKRTWTKLSANYTANGTEKVIIIGYFNQKKKYKGNCHYYIDDVTVTLLEKENPPVDSLKTIPTEKELLQTSFLPKLGETGTLKNIFFETNKSELLPASFPELDKLVAFLSIDLSTIITIQGHTDKTGNEKQNLILSEARAKAVSDYLRSNGIAVQRIKYVGAGSELPIVSNETEDGRQLNRRVEFTIKKK